MDFTDACFLCFSDSYFVALPLDEEKSNDMEAGRQYIRE